MLSRLAATDLPEIVDVLSDAFYEYPVMRYVLGERAPYDARLHRLVELFVSGRVYRDEPMFGVRDEAERLVAAATTTAPDSPPAPPDYLALRDAMWREIGDDARSRYESFTAATAQFAIEPRHYHLNMIGVRRSHQGRGLSRVLLEAVHDLSRTDRDSAGVSLSTERLPNVKLYERFGYRVVGHARVDDTLESWTMFRADRGPG